MRRNRNELANRLQIRPFRWTQPILSAREVPFHPNDPGHGFDERQKKEVIGRKPNRMAWLYSIRLVKSVEGFPPPLRRLERELGRGSCAIVEVSIDYGEIHLRLFVYVPHFIFRTRHVRLRCFLGIPFVDCCGLVAGCFCNTTAAGDSTRYCSDLLKKRGSVVVDVRDWQNARMLICARIRSVRMMKDLMDDLFDSRSC